MGISAKISAGLQSHVPTFWKAGKKAAHLVGGEIRFLRQWKALTAEAARVKLH